MRAAHCRLPRSWDRLSRVLPRSWDLVASNGNTRRVVPGCPRRSGSSTRVGADRRTRWACAICRRFCACASSRSLPGWPAMCWRRAGCEGGLPASCLADRPQTLKGTHGRKGDGGKHDSGTAGPDDVVGGGRGGDVDGGVLGCLVLHLALGGALRVCISPCGGTRTSIRRAYGRVARLIWRC